MNIWKISIQNLKSKPLYTFLSVLVLSLSIALLLGVKQLKASFKHQMDNNLAGIELVVGAKGSPLQLVLASILHIDNPTGNISYNEAQKIIKNPFIKTAVPISYGDNYKGFKIVGTTSQFATLYTAEIEKGKYFSKPLEVVLGNSVAQQLNLKIGDTFLSSHGLVENTIEIHKDALKVVGILKPTQKVIDRLIITNLESIWNVHHHEDDDHHNHEQEITSLLLQFKSPMALLSLPKQINKDTNMQAVLPKYELDKLYEYTGFGLNTISWIAYIILIISGLTIFISLYKMVKERAFDLALLRTYGASNFQLIKMVLYEGLLIGFTAFIIGFLLIKAGLYFLLKFAQSDFKQNILQKIPFQDVLQTSGLILAMIILAIVLAIYPIIKMNISTILSNEK